MVNSNVDEIDKNKNDTEKEQNDTSGQESSLTVLKEESFEEESLNKVIITEITDEVACNNSVNASVICEDTVINIEVNKTHQAPQPNACGKTSLWPFIHRRTLLTRYLWQQGAQRKQKHQRQVKQEHLQQWHILQGYPQKKEQVMFQQTMYKRAERPNFGAGYDEGPGPLVYDPKTRNSFVLVVMIMVLIMLLITTAFIAVVLTTPFLSDFFREAGMIIMVPSITFDLTVIADCTDGVTTPVTDGKQWFNTFSATTIFMMFSRMPHTFHIGLTMNSPCKFTGIMIGLLIANYAMMCSICARVSPCCYVMLVITTLCMCLMAAQVSACYHTHIVFLAAIITTSVVIVCLILACTSFDFTKWALYLVVLGTAVSIGSIVMAVTMRYTSVYIKPLHLGILIVSVLIQSVVLVIELQMVLGGRAIEIAEDDFALAAFMIYTSIVDVFIKMVQILGLMEDV